MDGVVFRDARAGDARRIAELFVVATSGVASYVWSTMDYPGLSPIEIGERCCAGEGGVLSYRSAVVAVMGSEVVGMLMAFPLDPDVTAETPGPDPVLAPFSELKAPGCYHIWGLAVDERARQRGIARRFMEIASERTLDLGIETQSLVVFERNVSALRWYERLGFREIDRRAVVPHPMIKYTGDALLMTAQV